MLTGLALLAIASFAGAALLSALQILPPAAPIHLALAVGVMPLIVAAMSQFVPVLSRSVTPSIGVRMLPLLMLLAGVLVFFAFAASNQTYYFAAHLALLVAAVFAGWILRRAHKAVGKPHPCLYWYFSAIICLVLALAAIAAMALWPEQYLALKRLHLHLNIVGFLGLTAIATLQVLMPTVASRPDVQASTRLHQHLKWALGGTLLIALGAAWFKPLLYLGFLLWLLPLSRLGNAWYALYRREIFQINGAASSLATAYAGLCIALLLGALHAYHIHSPAEATLVFILIFLWPLVTGAVSHLLPIWLRPGVQTAWHEQMRQQLGTGGAYRALLFLSGGMLVAMGWHGGMLFSLAALVIFLWQLAATLRSHAASTR